MCHSLVPELNLMRVLFHASPEKLCRFQSGPFGKHIQGYAALLCQLGYASETGWAKIRMVSEFGHWLDQKHIGIEMLDEQQVAVFVEKRFEKVKRREGEKATLDLFLKHLRQTHAIPACQPQTRQTPSDSLIQNYRRFLLEERNLGPETVNGYISAVARFLAHRFKGGKVEVEKLRANDIISFVMHDSTTRGRRASQLATTALRSLFRFLLQDRQIGSDLARAVPAVAGWRLSELPRYLESAQVEMLLKCCDRRRKAGKRNYAILLLMARLGLRAGEVARLALEDIDWSAGELCIRGKGARIDRLPLIQPVGEAIADYLRKARPPCSSRCVFIRVKAPYAGFSCPPNGICCLVRRALKEAKLNPPHKGAHILRHSLATRMLSNGASMSQIGRVLRHKSIQTTEVYAKVDLNALRRLAQPWPGVAT